MKENTVYKFTLFNCDEFFVGKTKIISNPFDIYIGIDILYYSKKNSEEFNPRWDFEHDGEVVILEECTEVTHPEYFI